eukprot:TRINITY_DN110965_c0_g1_i1.p1 TRINITY_DN110965_c0_g1~~TRINITY_DN110965_c0_g1_i1.p1  ORF type:complete len:596 (-),score=110.59 TRINITY_DN110965_c0_g1_i1:9-1796(-)
MMAVTSASNALPRRGDAKILLRRSGLLSLAFLVGALVRTAEPPMAFARVPLWQRKTQRQMSPIEIRKIRESQEDGRQTGFLKVPYDGLQLGADDKNIALVDGALDKLAKEPVILRLDRSGRTILEAENVTGLVPWSPRVSNGLHSAQAPLSWEEFAARYGGMDKTVQSSFGQIHKNQVEDQLEESAGKDDFRIVRTFTWPGGAATGGGPASIMLIGVSEFTARSRRLAARAVYEVEPSALLVQLCRERVGRELVMPREHKEAAANYARGYAATNPHRLRRVIHKLDVIAGDQEALLLWTRGQPYSEAVREFAQSAGQPGMPKVLCLGDVLASKLELLRARHGNETLKQAPALSARAKQIARGLIGMAANGHKVVLGIVDTDLVGTVTAWLERSGASMVAVADASDIESNRESLAADSRLGLQGRGEGFSTSPAAAAKVAAEAQRVLEFGGRAPLGAFLNEQGLATLSRRQQRLLQMTRLRDLVHHCQPEKEWKVCEELYIAPGNAIPGPEALIEGKKAKGFRFELGLLEIPDHYLRDAGMERHADNFWQSLLEDGEALEPWEPMELSWWAAGGTEMPDEASEPEQDLLEAWTSGR